MSDTDDQGAPGGAKGGERIAKVLARAGVASRREVERMIAAGVVAVNGRVIDSPALNIGPRDRVTVEGRPVAEAEPARLWLYYKPLGLVTSEADEKGRDTVFENLPEDMPRVMSVGRLDLNSEGLLLLTNDGELKRRLELPSTGWLRKYRVRVNGRPEDATLEPLRQGIQVEGERFQPMTVSLDRQQGANAWLTVGLREGKNREIRRALAAIGLTVNRLIRVSYGPFRLGEMEPGAVEEVRPKVLRDQLGIALEEEAGGRPRRTGAAAVTVERSRGGSGVSRVGRMEKPAPEGEEAKPDRKARRAARAPARLAAGDHPRRARAAEGRAAEGAPGGGSAEAPRKARWKGAEGEDRPAGKGRFGAPRGAGAKERAEGSAPRAARWPKPDSEGERAPRGPRREDGGGRGGERGEAGGKSWGPRASGGPARGGKFGKPGGTRSAERGSAAGGATEGGPRKGPPKGGAPRTPGSGPGGKPGGRPGAGPTGGPGRKPGGGPGRGPKGGPGRGPGRGPDRG